ncbi:MAG TPA: NADP-dependent oxidoreductase [Deltaproteobacteria bacterium]|jgi:NADPH-dependent curcumin reductase CurA|nr:NADP-dependent oxidoreductase [Deltaproteobacteria bacterium]
MTAAAGSINRQWVLASRPSGLVKESNFAWKEVLLPKLEEGQFLVRNLYLSFDPAMRGWMEDRPSYIPPVAVGEVMRAGSVGQVVESKSPAFRPGDFVQGTFGWQDYAVSDGRGLLPVSKLPPGVPLTWPLGVLGITALTAYFGLLDLGKPKAGETVVVSGAAGATGSVAAQIAKLKGCRVIGIAGGRDKCAWLRDEAGLDAAIDYKAEDVGSRLRDLCPRSVEIYFDNVGGEILDAVLAQIATRARIVLCGGISGYNASEPPPGPRNYMNLVIQRARMEGFIVLDYAARFGEAVRELAAWVTSGKIKHQEDVQVGLENAPRTLLRLFEGKNLGKQLLKVSEPPL